MKRAIIIAAKFIALATIATVVILASLTLLLAMPDILSWVAEQIGSFCTWVIFIGAVIGFISWCMAE
jgi:hypothetical protein